MTRDLRGCDSHTCGAALVCTLRSERTQLLERAGPRLEIRPERGST